MGGIIHAYYDCVSPYSYFAFIHLQRLHDILAGYGVSTEIHPIFLGGIMNGSGNTPPWKNPAKQKHGQVELERAIRYFKVPPFGPPSFFPILTILPQRALTYIKHNYPPDRLETTFSLYWQWFFYKHQDISQPEILRNLLLSPEAGFSSAEADKILAATSDKKWKEALTSVTQEALDRGAFGAPFFWVVKTQGENGEGEVLGEAEFFGSDRFHQIWDFLGLPYDDIKLHARSNESRL